MELIITTGGRNHRAKIDRESELYRIEVDGRSYEVDAAAAGPSASSLLIDGQQLEVSVHRQGDGEYLVTTHHGSGSVQVTDPLTHLALESRGGADGARTKQVTAYMPGRVVAVLVEEGADVQAGQGIVVLEAMKMENEIQAEEAGTIETIHVETGQAVEGGDPLFTLA